MVVWYTARCGGRRALSALALGLAGTCLLGCGDDASFEGCGSDTDCKGDRVCEQGMCIDPTTAQDPDIDQTASGAGGTGSGGSDGSGGSAGGASGGGALDDPEFEAACIADCEAQQAAGCEMPGRSLDQCMAQCLVLDEANGGYCLDERRRTYLCLAEGGYTCVSSYPQPNVTCIEESQDLASCHEEQPCRSFCGAAEGTSCAPDGDCFEACRADELDFDEIICRYDYTRLLTCWSQELECAGDRPSIAGCEALVAQVADCIGLRQSECEGLCWAADLIGCGSDSCVDDCSEKLEDTACGWEYRRLVECGYEAHDGLHLACEQSEIAFTSECDEELAAYDACVETAM